jgi:hypothetical protein
VLLGVYLLTGGGKIEVMLTQATALPYKTPDGVCHGKVQGGHESSLLQVRGDIGGECAVWFGILVLITACFIDDWKIALAFAPIFLLPYLVIASTVWGVKLGVMGARADAIKGPPRPAEKFGYVQKSASIRAGQIAEATYRVPASSMGAATTLAMLFSLSCLYKRENLARTHDNALTSNLSKRSL